MYGADRSLHQASEGSSRLHRRDHAGLRHARHAAGEKTWFFMYRVKRPASATLGDWALFGSLARPGTLQGEDCRGQSREGRRRPGRHENRRPAGRTIAELAKKRRTKHARAKKSSWPRRPVVTRQDILPAWRHRPVKEIKRGDVVALVDGIADPHSRNAPELESRYLNANERTGAWRAQQHLCGSLTRSRWPECAVKSALLLRTAERRPTHLNRRALHGGRSQLISTAQATA